MPGPIPERSEVRRRRSEPASPPLIKTSPEDMERMPFPIELSPRAPERDDVYESWHPLAQELWRSLEVSPESMWMTSAGWAIARVECEQLSRELKPQVVGTSEGYYERDSSDPIDEGTYVPPGPIWASIPMKGASLAAHHRIWASLGLLEGDRRRMGREVTLHQPSEDELAAAGVPSITRHRENLLTPRPEED